MIATYGVGCLRSGKKALMADRLELSGLVAKRQAIVKGPVNGKHTQGEFSFGRV